MTAVGESPARVNYFSYDAMLRRFAVEESTGVSYFTWDANGMNLLAERDASGSVTAYYTHGYTPVDGIGSLVAAKRNEAGASYYQYPVYDHRGSVVRLLDENGTPTAYFEYDAWGNQLKDQVLSGTASNRFRYQSNWIELADDPDKVLELTPTRLYHAGVGRFLGRDKDGGVAGGYHYAINNSVAFVDANGLDPTVPKPKPKPKPQPWDPFPSRIPWSMIGSGLWYLVYASGQDPVAHLHTTVQKPPSKKEAEEAWKKLKEKTKRQVQEARQALAKASKKTARKLLHEAYGVMYAATVIPGLGGPVNLPGIITARNDMYFPMKEQDGCEVATYSVWSLPRIAVPEREFTTSQPSMKLWLIGLAAGIGQSVVLADATGPGARDAKSWEGYFYALGGNLGPVQGEFFWGLPKRFPRWSGISFGGGVGAPFGGYLALTAYILVRGPRRLPPEVCCLIDMGLRAVDVVSLSPHARWAYNKIRKLLAGGPASQASP